MAYQCAYCYRNAVKIGSSAWCSIHLPPKAAGLSSEPPTSQGASPNEAMTVDEILTRQNGLHGVQHQIMGGKNLAFEYCTHCKETAAKLEALRIQDRISELELFVNKHEVHPDLRENYIDPRITELQATLKALETPNG